MVLDGHMKVGPYEGVKTRSWEWDYRGPLLFYNSGRTARPAVSAYGYHDAPQEHKVIIGVGELVDVRSLTPKETLQMVCNFNNLTEREVRKIIRKEVGSVGASFVHVLRNFYACGDYVAPYPTGFFFKNLVRFDKPVKFNWPAGPVKPITTRVVSGSPLHVQLNRAGL